MHRAAEPSAPLVLTLGLDPPAQARFEQERTRYFPARLNRIPAHLSLFHALPGEQLPAIQNLLHTLASSTPPFPLQVHDLMRLGRGVAYALDAPQLDALHQRLRSAWLDSLTRQDLQPLRPHVVVQNKVDPAEARRLFATLEAAFRPWQAEAVSLLLWHYQGGPWSLAREFPFTGNPQVAP